MTFIYVCGQFHTDTINQTVFGKEFVKLVWGKWKLFRASLKQTQEFRNTFCLDKRLCFLAGKSYPSFLGGWLRDSGYPFHYDLPLCDTIWDCWPLFTLFAIREFENSHANINRFQAIAVYSCPALLQIKDTINTVKYKGYYTVARRYEFYVLVTRTISHSFAALTHEI